MTSLVRSSIKRMERSNAIIEISSWKPCCREQMIPKKTCARAGRAYLPEWIALVVARSLVLSRTAEFVKGLFELKSRKIEEACWKSVAPRATGQTRQDSVKPTTASTPASAPAARARIRRVLSGHQQSGQRARGHHCAVVAGTNHLC